ncbi:NAD(+) diphosphatase [Desulfobacter curvatus]|uniref:NAD(+) diphosphatase n=1 Tax=Desulfobacter curvatus TaxID=2290 RepID=UPI0003696B88|nr:NAD(+) diphosphatase [Desulfobacter curvatus]
MFIPSPSPASPEEAAAWIFLFDGTALVVDPETGQVPFFEPNRAKPLVRTGLHVFGTLHGIPCCCGILVEPLPESGLSILDLRTFYQGAGEDFRLAVACGRFIADLHTNNHFCGRCGTLTRIMEENHGRICPACGLHTYPRISPAVIMGVTRGDEILLARGMRFPKRKLFSVLAGFLSPGETLEECVAREVYEETRIRVKNVRYVKSQPWPFPDSLMIGFTAEYKSGEIEIDPKEIIEAEWFKANSLPLIPDAYTLSGQLIREFVLRSNK